MFKMKKKLLFVDHYYHKKTKSTLFFSDLLSESWDVKFLYLKEQNQKLQLDDEVSELRKEKYDVVVLFQMFPEKTSFDLNFDYDKGVFIPMLDGTPPFESLVWDQYADFKILFFSSSQFKQYSSNRLGLHDTKLVQYFPEPKEIENYGSDRSCFFWKRIRAIGVKDIALFFGKQIETIAYHTSKDPGQSGKEDFFPQLYRIKKLKWFHDDRELDKEIQESTFYFAPRQLEGIGHSFLNAMNLQRIVVAPNNPTMNEYIQDGETGFLYDQSNPYVRDLSQYDLQLMRKKIREYMDSGFNKWRKEEPEIIEWIKGNQAYAENLNILIDCRPSGNNPNSLQKEKRTLQSLIRQFHTNFPGCKKNYFLLAPPSDVYKFKCEKDDSIQYLDVTDIDSLNLSSVDIFVSIGSPLSENIKKSDWIRKILFITEEIELPEDNLVTEERINLFTPEGLRQFDEIFTPSSDSKETILRIRPNIASNVIKTFKVDKTGNIEISELGHSIVLPSKLGDKLGCHPVFPKITVVMAVYNLIKNSREKSFVRAVRSVRRQNYSGIIEIVVVDGGSNDGTVALLERLLKDELLDRFISEPDDGVYDAMNKGAALSTGDYLTFLNSDDYYHNSTGLQRSIEKIIERGADYSFSDCLGYDEPSGTLERWKATLDALPFGTHYCHQTMICSKKMFNALGGFDLSYKMSSDSDFCIRAFSDNFKGVNSGIVYVTYFSGGMSSDSKKVRSEHSLTFYKNIGIKHNLSRTDCFDLWLFQGLQGRDFGEIASIISKLPESSWIEYGLKKINISTQPFDLCNTIPMTYGAKLGIKIAKATDLLLKNRFCYVTARFLYRSLKPLYKRTKPLAKKILNKFH